VSTSSDGEIRVTFFTRIERFAPPDVPIAVPVKLRRIHLSQMVNTLLQIEPDQAKQFDFLVNGEFLRTSLGKLIEAKGIYTEEILKIEFVELLAPPQPPHDFPHEDWVSSVAGRLDGMTLTGSYDHAARMWNSSGELVATLDGHSAPVKAVAWIPHPTNVDRLTCVSGAQDESLILWSVNSATRKVKCLNVCKGHTNEVTAVAAQPTGDMFASGSVDQSIRLWGTEPDTAEPGKKTSKRRKVRDEGEGEGEMEQHHD